MKENINFNYNECVKEYDKLGETIYVNICNKEETSVQWGFTGWFCLVFLALIIMCFAILFIYLIKLFIEDLKY